MKMNEKTLRRMIKTSLEEMALKSMQVGLPREMPAGEESVYFRTPEQINADKSLGDHGIGPDWSSEESYAATKKTWGRKTYASYAARQFERFPIGLNVFVIPQAADEIPYNRFTDPNDQQANQDGLRIIRRHFPDAQIDSDDFNVVVLIPKYSELRGDLYASPAALPKYFLDWDGIYNTFHAFFDGGILNEITSNIYDNVMEILDMIGGKNEDLEQYAVHRQGLIKMGKESPLARIFRLRTLRMNRLTADVEIVPELCTVALIRQTIPVNIDFPPTDSTGREFSPEEILRGTALLEEMALGLEDAKNAYKDLAGKTVIGSPENVALG